MPIILPRNEFNLLRAESICSASEVDSGATKNKSSQAQHVHVVAAPPRRRVVFNRDVYVQETIHVNDYTDDELDDTWYTRQDFKDQKAEFAVTVRLIATERYTGDDDFHCARGLEYRHREGAKARQTNKLKGLMSVLEEQERQQIAGEENDEMIALAYTHANFKCRHAAHAMGLYDEDEVFGPFDDSTVSSTSISARSKDICSLNSVESNKKAGLLRFFGRAKK